MMKTMIFPLRLAAICFFALPASGEPVYEQLFNFNEKRIDIKPETQTLGKYPQSALVPGGNGDQFGLYGTTMLGGEANCGTIFRMTTGGRLTTLVEFTGNGSSNKGSEPTAGLVVGNDNNFYGTTSTGGSGITDAQKGFGTIFRMTPAGKLTTLVEFTGKSGEYKGNAPRAGLIKDEAGNLYGTTSAGGTHSCGTIFKLSNVESDSNIKFTTLVEFSGSDGKAPLGRLLLSSDRQNLYGTTSAGGAHDFGTVFMAKTVPGKPTTLCSFTGKGGEFIGNTPTTGLVQVGKSSFFGTTALGGANDFGTIFRIVISGTSLMSFATQVEFTGIKPGPDGIKNLGRTPRGDLCLAIDGSLYGTTSHGGTFDNGTVFRMKPDSRNVETLVNFTFNGGTDKGAAPAAGLVQSSGILYGTTTLGSSSNNGSIFRMTTGGDLKTLIEFAGKVTSNAGILPVSDMVKGKDGGFYGTTSGGASDYGTIFKVTPEGILKTLVTFKGRPSGDEKQLFGKTPNSLCLNKKDGNFYGTTASGGIEEGGTCFVMTPEGNAYTLFRFTGKSGPYLGSSPTAGLVQDEDGNLYGTTSAGGANGFGTVFMMKRAKITMSAGGVTVRAGTMRTMVNFTGNGITDMGRAPVAGLCMNHKKTILYGTTSAGGTHDKGTIFSIPVIRHRAGWNVTTLVNFTGKRTDGRNELSGSAPKGPLTPDESGLNFYGTTSAGGTGDFGTVFMITAGGKPTTLVSFTGNGTRNKGRKPTAGLVLNRDGSFFGTTSAGGSTELGTVFRIRPPSKSRKAALETLVTFTGKSLPTKGSAPAAGLVQGNNGNYYGVTSTGGASSLGTVFMMTPSGSLTTLAEFTGDNTINMGISPFAGLTQDTHTRNGDYYGTTQVGGAFGFGTVFRITPGGTLTTLVEFSGNGPTNKGSLPSANLLQDPKGDFYGTTDTGGAFNCGTVFRMSRSGKLETLVEFTGDGPTDKGKTPAGGLMLGSDRNFYGTTVLGGTAPNNSGTIFRMTPKGDLETIVEFTGIGTDRYSGSAPRGGLVQEDHFLYGTTSAGGLVTDMKRPNGNGTIFMTTLGGELTTLVRFTGKTGDSMGSSPTAGLMRYGKGNFFGTTVAGGANDMGTIFRLTTNRQLSGTTLKTLVEFAGPPAKNGGRAKNTGRAPRADLVLGGDGNLYGTTQSGGIFNNGTVFRMRVDGNQVTTLKSFDPYDPKVASIEGAPSARMIEGSDGNLYGTTRGPDGSIYRLVFKGAPLVTDVQHTANSGDGEVLTAKVNSRGVPTVVWLDHGTDRNLEGRSVESVKVAANLSGYQTHAVGFTLGKLPGTGPHYYRFRAVQVGSNETSVSPVKSFSTLSPPSVSLWEPIIISASGETANIKFRAIVMSPDNPARVYCEWGTDGNSFPGRIEPEESTDSILEFPALDLEKGRLYYYRVIAANVVTNSNGEVVSGGKTTSRIGEFTTPIECIANIGGARVIGNNVELRGMVNPRGSKTTGEFQISPDDFKDDIVSSKVLDISKGLFVDTPVSVAISSNNFDQDRTYSYRMQMSSVGGTVISEVRTFTVAGISGRMQKAPDGRPSDLFTINVGTTPTSVTGGWRFQGEQAWRPTGNAAGLEQSNRIIEFMPVFGFTTPTSQAIEISSSAAKSYSGHYAPAGTVGSGGLVVSFKPDSVIPNAKWRLVKPGGFINPWLPASDPRFPLQLVPGSYLVESMLDGSTHVTPPQQMVTISNGKVTSCTFAYFESFPTRGAQPISVNQNTSPPHAYVGQIFSDSGAGSGFVVQERVVVTAGHVVFDETTLSFATGLHWYFQRDRKTYEPRPMIPRGAHLMGDYAAAREAANSDGGGAPGAGNPETQNRDAAALFFNENAGRGGYAGYLASDKPNSEFLSSNDLKILAGYPSGGEASNPGILHASAPLGVSLAPSIGNDTFGNELRIYSTSDISGKPGMSGGPLFVKYENLYYPAGIYLGGDNQIVVRAIDSEVTDLITRANTSSTSGNNHTDGGRIHTTQSSGFDALFAGLEVTIKPEAAQKVARWYITELRTDSPGSSERRGPFDSESGVVRLKSAPEYHYSIEFLRVMPFSKPAVVQLGGESEYQLTKGKILNFEFTYTSQENTLAVPSIRVVQAGKVIANGGSINFGNLVAGKEREISFTIGNTGKAELTGLRITKGGENEDDFTITQQPDGYISGPSGSTTFKVRFKPSASGIRKAAIYVANNDDSNSPFEINLAGTGGPALPISITLAGRIITDESPIDFGKVSTTSTRTLTIKNIGSTKISDLKANVVGPNRGDFTVTPLPSQLADGASRTFKVTFRRATPGISKATLLISSSHQQLKSFQIHLSANKIGIGNNSSFLAEVGPLPRMRDSSFDVPPFTVENHQILAGRTTVHAVVLPDGRRYLTLSLTRPPVGFHPYRAVEVSPNLVDWYSGGRHTTIMQDDHMLLKVRDNTPLAPNKKRYIRLKDD